MSPLRLPMDGIKYLGITVDNNLKNLYKLNYLPLLSKIEDDLRRWMSLPLTLIGRVNCIKMNVQPRLQYFFQFLPIPLPQSFFKTFNRYVRQFIWNCKAPRISMGKLSWDYGSGGLRLPSFKIYYLTAQMRFIRKIMKAAPDVATMTKRDLLSLLSHLNFAMRIIPQGRSFISRLLKNSKQSTLLDKPGRRLQKQISSFGLGSAITGPAYPFSTTKSQKCLYPLNSSSMQLLLSVLGPKEMLSLPQNAQSTALLELYPMVVACLLWGPGWFRKKIVVFCDNKATVNIINKGCSSIPSINRFIRRLT